MALFQVASADEVVRTMIDHMTNGDNQSHLPLKSGLSSVHDLFKLHFNACRYFIFECNLLCLMQETVWLCVWTTWELYLPWRWLLLLKQPSTLWVTYYLSTTNNQTPSLLRQTRMWKYLICASFAIREPRHDGCQGNVWVFHDIAGDGRSVHKPDEGRSRNAETVWWAYRYITTLTDNYWHEPQGQNLVLLPSQIIDALSAPKNILLHPWYVVKKHILKGTN